jgi:hypothetical protein
LVTWTVALPGLTVMWSAWGAALGAGLVPVAVMVSVSPLTNAVPRVKVTVGPAAAALTTLSAVAVPLAGVTSTEYPLAAFKNVIVSEPVVGAAVKPSEVPPLLRLATGTSSIVYVVFAPNWYSAADNVGPELPTVTVLEVPGAPLPDAVTEKVNEPVLTGARAVKSTSTLVPLLRVQDALRKMVTPVAVDEPAPPAPAVPAWIHEPPTMSILVGDPPRLSEGVTVTEPSALPATVVPAVKLTEKSVEALLATLLGEATTLATAPEGEPMV